MRLGGGLTINPTTMDVIQRLSHHQLRVDNQSCIRLKIGANAVMLLVIEINVAEV